MKRSEDEKRGWILVAIFLLIGLLCVILAGNLAIRFAPSWSLNADMRSRLSPDSAFIAPAGYAMQPVDSDILTPPVWFNVFLTPGQIFPTRTPRPTATPTEFIPPTRSASPTPPPTATPTNTLVYFGPATSTSRPVSTNTSNPPTSTSTPTNSSAPTDTAIPPTATAPPTSIPTGTSTPTPTLTPTPTNTPLSQADLQVTISDGVIVYLAGGTLTYNVVASNNGPSDATGVQITSAIPSQVLDWSWNCAGSNNGASGCDPSVNSTAAFSDSVDLPSGASILYTVSVNIKGKVYNSLSTSVSIAPGALSDPALGNNSAADTDDLLNSLPYAEIGTSPDGMAHVLQPGTSLTLALNTPLVVNGHPSWDLIMYEMPNGSGIAMDWIILQVSDGTNWYTVFNWGDNVADTDSNMNIAVIGGQEVDNRDFTKVPESDILYPFNSGTDANPSTGIVMDLDGVVPNGTYPYLRIISPTGDSDGGAEVDAISIFP